ncbi:unnamed protein product [Somion occarium]|uniref:Uncharacterized protein n=1 Tax=Somion occarium TaxID=3059160 RepID=A0ABP1E7N0_9APHY
MSAPPSNILSTLSPESQAYFNDKVSMFLSDCGVCDTVEIDGCVPVLRVVYSFALSSPLCAGLTINEKLQDDAYQKKLLQVDSEFLQVLRTSFGRKDYSAVIGHPAFINRDHLGGLFECTPPQPSADIERGISSLIESITPNLQCYLHRNFAWPTYKSTSTDAQTENFVDSLEIPMTTPNVPCLLLYGLGLGIVKPEVVSRIFYGTEVATHLINTSGSGKTQILCEGLLQSWGFYFTCDKQQAISLGLHNLPWVLQNMDNGRGT